MSHYSKLKEVKVSGKTLYKGILDVKLDTVRLVNGHTATRLYFDHQGASGVLPIEGDSIYLVQQFRYPVGRMTLELPAGKREKGQTYLACARAELKQETGLSAKHMKEVMMFNPSNAFSNEELHLYIATGLTRGKDSPDEDEFINLKKIPLKTAYRRWEKGQICDAKTVIMLQWYRLHHR